MKDYDPRFNSEGESMRANTHTKQSLGEHIGRYYGNVPGGLDAAMESAARARVANNQAGALNRNIWSQFPFEDVNRKEIPVNIQTGVTATKGNVGLSYFYGDNLRDRAIIVAQTNGSKFPQETLEHELSHSVFGTPTPGADGLAYYPAAESYIKSQDPKVRKHGKYMLGATEIDVRMAEIKRWYAAKTGRLADSPEESQKAWEMWHAEGLPADKEQDSPFGAYGPSYKGGFYDSLPDNVKKEMQRRMMELVSNDSNQGGMYS